MGRHDQSFEQYDDRDPWGRSEPRGFQRRQRGGFGAGGPGGPPAWGGWGGWGQWGEPGRGGHRHGGHAGPPVPPPWLTGLFGMGRPEPGRGPRVRRGDVRAAILDVLRAANEKEESPNGYQVIQQITDRSGGVWKPSPGSVYPTVQQLQDEELVELDEGHGRRALRLTAKGAAWCADHAEELARVWAPFDRDRERAESHAAGAAGAAGPASGQGDIKAEIGQVMSAVWQIVTSGSEAQRRAAVDVLVEARRGLYGILADGPNAEQDTEQDTDEDPDPAGS